MTRRERLIHILDRLKFPHAGIVYDIATDAELAEFVRNKLWWTGIARNNARAMTQFWANASIQQQQANDASQAQSALKAVGLV